MRLRTKLLAGILVILLLQIVVAGGFTLRTFFSLTRSSTESDLVRDWEHTRSYVEELKHKLYTDIHQLLSVLRDGPTVEDSLPSLRNWIRYFIGLSDADRIVLTDRIGAVLVDESAAAARVDGISVNLIDPSKFRFPRNEFMTATDRQGNIHLSLVTGTIFTPPDGGSYRLYLITNIDKARAEAINEARESGIAFFVGERIAASNIAEFPLDAGAKDRFRTIDVGNHPYEIFSRPLSHEVPGDVYLVSLKSLLPQRLYIRTVLLSFLTAFLLTLAASLFVAAGITGLVVSPFSRLNQWLHAYMDTGTVGQLDIKSRDEVGFLASAFHTMITTLIGEKRVIGEQLDQIRFLHEYNERIMNNMKAAIVVTDAGGAIEFCNTYFLELTGSDFTALKGALLTSVLSRHFYLRTGDRLPENALDGESALEGLKLQRAGQETMLFTAKRSPIPLSGSRSGSLIVLEDITAAERFWEKMMIAERVTSLGILSAGMAHEINNPLGSILSHVNYLKAVEREPGKLDSLSWIESETDRIAAIVQRIHAYSAPMSAVEGRADINATARQTIGVLKFTLEKRGLSISLDLEEGLPPVICSPNELKQVILNVVWNACQACGKEGRIVITTRAGQDGSIRLSVTDNGPGIDPAHMKNIFDPFFTTKAASEGSGLGLSICHAIVKRVGGDIRVDSACGKGTEVEVTLNVHERPHRG